jgi:hypothetical protein
MTATRTPPPPFERLGFFDGAELLHRDLHDVVGHESRMLALHVLAAHHTWGIAVGLDASLDPSSTIVTVSEGAAFDRDGVVVSLATTSIGAPTLATPIANPTFHLLLRAVSSATVSCVRGYVCDGLLPVAPRVELRWSLGHTLPSGQVLLGDDVQVGIDIPIASFVRQPGGTLTAQSGSERRVVRGLFRPHIASGFVAAGSFAWSDGPTDIWTHVDTSASGFSTTPVYIATLGGVAASAPMVGPWLHVEEASPQGFIARLVAGALPNQPAAGLHTLLRSAARSATITWTGAESTRACAIRLLPSVFAASLGGSV